MTTELEIFDGGNDKRKYYKWENAIKTNNQHCHHIFSSGQSRSLQGCINNPVHPWTIQETQSKQKTEQALREWNSECQKSVTFLKNSIGPSIKAGLEHLWDSHSLHQSTDYTFRDLYREIQHNHGPSRSEIATAKRDIIEEIYRIKPVTNDRDAKQAFTKLTTLVHELHQMRKEIRFSELKQIATTILGAELFQSDRSQIFQTGHGAPENLPDIIKI